MHAGVMADSGKYLTVRGVLAAVAEEVHHHLTCWRRGHDPVGCTDGSLLCRRCYRSLPAPTS